MTVMTDVRLGQYVLRHVVRMEKEHIKVWGRWPGGEERFIHAGPKDIISVHETTFQWMRLLLKTPRC